MCKEIFRKKRLRKDASDVPTGLLPLNSIRTAAVIIDGSGLNIDKCVGQIETFCQKAGVKLILLYVDMRKFNSKIPMLTDYEKTILKKDLNWYGRPSSHKSEPLLATPVDLYVCLYDSDMYCIKYISSTIKAKFKIGVREYPGDPYNFVVRPAAKADDGTVAPTDLAALFLKIKELLKSVQ